MIIYPHLIKGLKALASLLLSLIFLLSLAFIIHHAKQSFPDEKRIDQPAGYADFSSPQNKRNQRVKYGQQQHLDLPVFYFSIRPQYYPKELHKVLPLRERAAILGLLRDKVPGKAIRSWRQKIIAQLDTANADHSTALIRLLQSPSRKELKDQIQLARLNDIALPRETDALLAKKTASVLPSFHWHGMQNQWHQTAFNFIRGEWGTSVVDGQAVTKKVLSALPYTLLLNGSAILLLFLTAIGMGRWWAQSAHSPWVRLSRQISYFLYVMPLFWLAALAIAFLTEPTGFFPLPSGVEKQLNYSHYLLPLLCIWLSSFGYLSRIFEDNLRKEWQKPYIKMSRHRGLSEKKLLYSYALPNAVIPIITLLGAAFPALISGSLVIEVLFNIPGMGRLVWAALQEQDWPIVFNVILIIGVFAWLGRWGADQWSQYLDPRINWKEKV
jgi:peptide/nickel transport system permease protein